MTNDYGNSLLEKNRKVKLHKPSLMRSLKLSGGICLTDLPKDDDGFL